MQLLRAADRAATRWKDGGGLTREVAVFPAAADFTTFGWRVSLAEITSDGSFSQFPGIDRRLALVEGRLSLTITPDSPIELSTTSAPVAFPGDAPAYAKLPGGPAMDLNVMTRRGHFRSNLSRRSLLEPQRIETNVGTSLLVALGDIDFQCGKAQFALGALDAMMTHERAEVRLASTRGASSFYFIEILAVADAPVAA